MDANYVLRLLGDPGRFSWILALVLCVTYFPVTFNHLAMSIYGATPEHRCAVPDGVDHTDAILPDSSCRVYVNYTSSSNETTTCPNGYSYTLIDGESTIVNEWDLVCDRKWLPYAATSSYFAGVMLGGIVFGTLSDLFGRKPVIIITTVCYLFLGIIVHFVATYEVFVLLRVLIGVMMQGLQLCTYVFAVEQLGSQKYRAYFAGLFEGCWALGIMVLAGLAYWLKQWRWLQLAITVPSAIGCLYVWFLPESIRWLISKHRYIEALRVMKRAASYNNVSLPENIFKDAELNAAQKRSNDMEERRYTIWDIFRGEVLRRRACVMFYVWFATSLGYYGLSLNASKLAGNKYLNFFINGAIELPAYLSGMIIFSRIGRKIPLIVYFLVGGVACILAGVVPNETASTVLAWIGKFSMAGCWSVLYLYTSEIFPTVVRNAGVGASAFWARVGGILSPLVNLLGDYTEDWVPTVIFGIVALIGGFAAFALPETKDLNLPDTIEDVENEAKTANGPSVANGVENASFDPVAMEKTAF